MHGRAALVDENGFQIIYILPPVALPLPLPLLPQQLPRLDAHRKPKLVRDLHPVQTLEVEDEALQGEGQKGGEGAHPQLAGGVPLACAVLAEVLVVTVQELGGQQGGQRLCRGRGKEGCEDGIKEGRGILETVEIFYLLAIFYWQVTCGVHFSHDHQPRGSPVTVSGALPLVELGTDVIV